MVSTISPVETPSGKDAAYENFPVGSWLLPASLRPDVAVFYAFARAIDDIADSPHLTAAEKTGRLDCFAQALCGQNPDPDFAKAHAMRRICDARGITLDHGLDLIDAFKQDATKLRYESWDALMDYCMRSAAPVGRFLIDLHGGCRHGYGAADALCNALQVINHLQDCQDDYRTLDRVYLPGDWLAAASATVADLDRPACSTGLRQVLDRCLDGVEALLKPARRLPRQLSNRRLAMESAAILAIAEMLTDRLRRQDPLAKRVKLAPQEYAWCCARGAFSAWLP